MQLPVIGTSRHRAHAALAAAVMLLAGCGADRGVHDVAGGYNGGGLEGLTGGCYVNPTLQGTSVIVIDPTVKYQTMQGFGASVRLFDDPRTTNTLDPATKRGTAVPNLQVQQAILGTLYTDLGLTRVRFLAGDGGTEPVNDNADPLVADLTKFDFSWNKGDGQLDMMPDLTRFGLRTWFTSTPKLEPWMTESNPAEYAEWLFVTLRHWRDRGYEPPYVSLKNEPGSAASGGVWSGAYLRDVTKLLGARIKADGMKTKIVLPDDVDAREALARLQVVLADADARQYVGAVAYHVHGGTGGELEVKQLAQQYGIPIWVTDFSAPDLVGAATTLHTLITADGASAADYTWGYYGEHEKSQLVRLTALNGAYDRYLLTPQYYVMGQYSRYVKPGAIRIGATSADPEMLVSAYIVDDFKLVVIVTYTGFPYERPMSMDIRPGGPCVKSVETTRTSDTENGSSFPLISIQVPRISMVLPSRTVTTFVGHQ